VAVIRATLPRFFDDAARFIFHETPPPCAIFYAFFIEVLSVVFP
jgi:hypothetical protein